MANTAMHEDFIETESRTKAYPLGEIMSALAQTDALYRAEQQSVSIIDPVELLMSEEFCSGPRLRKDAVELVLRCFAFIGIVLVFCWLSGWQ